MSDEADGISLNELLPWLEFGCWTGLVLVPFLYYLNGPSVSPDQLAVRTASIVMAGVGGLVLRLVNRRLSKAGNSRPIDD